MSVVCYLIYIFYKDLGSLYAYGPLFFAARISVLLVLFQLKMHLLNPRVPLSVLPKEKYVCYRGFYV